MANNLRKSFTAFDASLAKDPNILSGDLGIITNGEKVVEVPTRNSFVYVRLRNNVSELIQAFNEKVSPSYGLPVLVVRDGNRYTIKGRDTERYSDWENFSAYLPRHANTHSFNVENGGAGDIVWVEGQQFMPALVIPSGSSGAGNVLIAPYSLKNLDGVWKYIGDTGTPVLTQYNPISGSVLILVSIDSVSGNPYLQATTGSYIPESSTGTPQLLSYLPFNNDPRYSPNAFVRIVSGTSIIDWGNIYDVRQFVPVVPTGTATVSFIQDEGIAKGTASTLNFLGSVVDVSVSGTVARVFITGSVGGGGGAFQRNLTSTLTLADGENLPIAEYLNLGTYDLNLNGDSLVYFVDDERDAPSNGLYYGRKDSGWVDLGAYFDTVFLPLSSMSAANALDLTDGGFTTLHSHSGVASTGTTITILDEGVSQGEVSSLNFVGGGIDASVAGAVGRIFVTGSISVHNSLSGIQGGGVGGDIFHLSSAQVSGLVSGSSTSLHSHAGSNVDYILVQHETASGNSGGDLVTGTWTTRTINTEKSDTGGHCSISANQITLAAGTYECEIFAPCYAVQRHRARLYNITDGTTTILGKSSYAAGAGDDAIVVGKFTIASAKVFEVQHFVTNGVVGNGAGVYTNTGDVEIFAVAQFWKVG